jgi:hypothetical protein
MASTPGRATLLGPVYLLIGLLLTMLVLALAVDLFGAPDWVETVFFIAGVACFAAMPYAFLGALARSRLVDADVLEAENVRLDAELQARVEELRASRQRIVKAGVAERRRLERDRGLGAALEALASRAPLPVELSHGTELEMPDAVESAAWRTGCRRSTASSMFRARPAPVRRFARGSRARSRRR